jgi:hypothetical protein
MWIHLLINVLKYLSPPGHWLAPMVPTMDVLLRRLKQEDCLSPGIISQPQPHIKTLSQNKQVSKYLFFVMNKSQLLLSGNHLP